jgi:hypothetical protein
VLRIERLVVVRVGDPGLPARDVLEREVGRVAAVAERHDEFRARLDAIEERVDRDTGPHGVELRPLRDAVDVDRDAFGGKRLQLVPCPASWLVDLAPDREVPPVGRRMRRRPRRENREVRRNVLARGHTRRISILPTATSETT